jgi:hypothetical protein
MLIPAVAVEVNYRDIFFLPPGMNASSAIVHAHSGSLELQVVGRVQFNAGAGLRQGQVKDELLSKPAPGAIHPIARPRHGSNLRVERDQRAPAAGEQSGVDDEGVRL